MANEPEPVITLPKGLDPHLDDDGEPVVTLSNVPNQPTYPLSDLVIEAMLVEYLNQLGRAKKQYVEVAKALLLAKAVSNGIRTKGGLDVYEESTLLLVIFLWCTKNKANPDVLKQNTVSLQKALKKFADEEEIDRADWPASPKGFSIAIKNLLPRLKLYEWTAIKLKDGSRSWEFKPIATGAGKRAKNSQRVEASDASDASDANHTPETNHDEEKPEASDAGEVGDALDGEQGPETEE